MVIIVLLNAIIENKEVSENIYAFHAQQAIEKILKAILTIHDIRIGKVHDLRLLMDELANHNQPFSTFLADDSISPII